MPFLKWTKSPGYHSCGSSKMPWGFLFWFGFVLSLNATKCGRQEGTTEYFLIISHMLNTRCLKIRLWKSMHTEMLLSYPVPESVAHFLMLQLYTGRQVQLIWSCIYIATVYKEAYWIYLKTRWEFWNERQFCFLNSNKQQGVLSKCGI